MNMEIGTEVMQLPEKEYINGILLQSPDVGGGTGTKFLVFQSSESQSFAQKSS
jgi:hypothetical protein